MIQSKPIPYFPGYTLIWDGLGNIKVYGRRRFQMTIHRQGHLDMVRFSNTKTTLIRICALTWLGLPPRVNKFDSYTLRRKFVALPINGDYNDLRPENVEWRTRRWFARNILSTLEREDILHIRQSSKSMQQLADQYNISKGHIWHIRHKRIYADVKESLF